MSKPVHIKPAMYAYYFIHLKEIAIQYGYNLVIHGSMNRDLDLIAIPWINNCKEEFDMINAFSMYLNGTTSDQKENFLYSVLPGGRHSYVININRGGYNKEKFVEDPQYYVDISVTPKV